MTVPFRARVLAGGAASAILALSNLGVLGPAGAAAGVGLVVLTGTEAAPVAEAVQLSAPSRAVFATRRPLHGVRVRAHIRQGRLTG